MTGLPLVLYWICCGIFGVFLAKLDEHWTIKVALFIWVPVAIYLVLKRALYG